MRWTISVGAWIVASAPRTSTSMFMRRNASSPPGLTVRRVARARSRTTGSDGDLPRRPANARSRSRAALQLGEPALRAELVLLARRRPREVRGAHEPRLALEQHEREDALRVRRREQHRQRGAVDVAEQRGALGPDRVHHRTHVVHPLLERRHAADTVGRARAALVEPYDAHAPRQLVEPGTDRLVVELHRREVEAAREDEVERPLAEDAVGDVDVTADRVPGVRALHPSKS